jgi:hypothetical protein
MLYVRDKVLRLCSSPRTSKALVTLRGEDMAITHIIQNILGPHALQQRSYYHVIFFFSLNWPFSIFRNGINEFLSYWRDMKNWFIFFNVRPDVLTPPSCDRRLGTTYWWNCASAYCKGWNVIIKRNYMAYLILSILHLFRLEEMRLAVLLSIYLTLIRTIKTTVGILWNLWSPCKCGPPISLHFKSHNIAYAVGNGRAVWGMNFLCLLKYRGRGFELDSRHECAYVYSALVCM